MKFNCVGKNGLNGDKIHIVPLEIGEKLEIGNSWKFWGRDHRILKKKKKKEEKKVQN